MFCSHTPACPAAHASDHAAARAIAARYEQGWSLLCNGVVIFQDGEELLPNGQVVPPARALAAQHTLAAGPPTPSALTRPPPAPGQDEHP